MVSQNNRRGYEECPFTATPIRLYMGPHALTPIRSVLQPSRDRLWELFPHAYGSIERNAKDWRS